jgi:hypothetical protein
MLLTQNRSHACGAILLSLAYLSAPVHASDLGLMTINGVKTNVTVELVELLPEQIITQQESNWRQLNYRVVRSFSNDWAVISSINTGLLRQVQARRLQGSQQTQVIRTQSPLQFLAKPKSIQPPWISALISSFDAHIVSSTESYDGFTLGASWLIRLGADNSSTSVQLHLLNILVRYGFQPHPASNLVNSQSQSANRVHHFSAPGGLHLNLMLASTDQAQLILITSFSQKGTSHGQ